MAAGGVTALIGVSGSGKSPMALSIMRLPPDGAEAAWRVPLGEIDLMAPSEGEMCRRRGAGIGMAFQEPVTALNPLQTVDDQVAETVRIHIGPPGPRRAAAPRRPWPRGASARPPPDGAPSPRALERPAPARRDRHGHGDGVSAAERRRAHNGARRATVVEALGPPAVARPRHSLTRALVAAVTRLPEEAPPCSADRSTTPAS